MDTRTGARDTGCVVALLLPALLFFAPFQAEDALAQHAEQASAAMRAGDYASAETHYRAVLKLQPGMAEARTNLGLALYLQKKYGDAVQAFSTALKEKPGMWNAWLFCGISQFHLNRPAEAAQSLEKYVRQRPADFQGLYYLGLARLALEEYDAAEKALLDAQRADPASIDVLYHLAQVYLGRARKDPASADRMWPLYQRVTEQIAAADPQSFRIGQLRAGFYEATARKKEAITELETILVKDPRVRGLHYTLGCLYIEALQYPKAEAQFRQELQLDSPYPRTWLQLGHTLLGQDKPQEAIEVLQKAADLEPKDRAAVWVDIGRAYRSLNRFQEATRAFQKAIALGQRDATVYYQLAMAARRAGYSEVADKALQESRRLRSQEQNAPLPRP